MARPLVLLLKYNKPTNDAFIKFASFDYGVDCQWADLTAFGTKIDVLSYEEVDKFLRASMPFDGLLMGDIFWPTGQNICQWCQRNSVGSFFLQHGQWIYTANKKNPRFLPKCTFVYGEDLRAEILTWPYGKRSRVEATGSPRYDVLNIKDGDYVYFSPPVILEKNASAQSITHQKSLLLLSALRGVDSRYKVLLHPHYREGELDRLKDLFPKAQYIDPEEPALPFIAAAGKVLTHRNSTVVLDGIACRKLVVLMNFMGHDDSAYPMGYFKGFAIESTTPFHCMENLGVVWQFPEKTTDEAKSFLVFGHASERISHLIKEELNVNT